MYRGLDYQGYAELARRALRYGLKAGQDIVLPESAYWCFDGEDGLTWVGARTKMKILNIRFDKALGRHRVDAMMLSKRLTIDLAALGLLCGGKDGLLIL